MIKEEMMIEILGVLRTVQIGEQPDVEELDRLIGSLTDEVGYMATVNLKRVKEDKEVQNLRDFLQEQVTETKLRRVCSLMGLSRREEEAVLEEARGIGLDDFHRSTVDELVYDIENFMVYLD